MKNNDMGLFMLGTLAGGGIMLLLFAFAQIPTISLSDQTTLPAPTMQSMPQLIALEPTSDQTEPTRAPLFPTITTEPSLAPTQMTVYPTPTRLVLSHEQKQETIGYSVEGRSLDVYTFGNGEEERMIVAGIHGGDEWNTVTLANQLIRYLNQNPDVLPENITLHILPNLNPDGEARAHNKYGRLNHNAVDLNRNFPVNWKMDWDRGSCWNSLPSSGGKGPGSEAETAALMEFIEGHSIDALISYHSAALGIFPGGLPWDENSVRLAQSLAEATSYAFPPLDTGCAYSGTVADYAVSAGIAAVDLELTNHTDTDFDQNLQALDVLLNFVP